MLERMISQTGYSDAMGCYPLFMCQDWTNLAVDLGELENSLVSLSLVADPLGAHTPKLLKDCFPDVCFPFKEHYVVDLTRVPEEYVSAHHRRNARNGLKKVTVEICTNPLNHFDDWVRLYRVLVARHGIRGFADFSEETLQQQLQVPGLVFFRAAYEGKTVGALLWYWQGDKGYYHLAASDEVGYTLNASYALFWTAITYFADEGLRWLVLGSGPGPQCKASNGLARFKRGWATGTRTAYFCGRILNPDRYGVLSKGRGSDYFPVYRTGEFG